MEEVHSAAEPKGFSDSPFTISQPPDIKNWFSSYVYESLALSSVREEEEDKCILGADKDHKPMNKNVRQVSDTNLYESSLPSEPPDIANWFSSYAYESPPVLDTNDDLYFSVGGEDSECVKETQAEEEEKIGGKDVCPSLFDQQLVSSAKVTDFPQSQHLLSEPPDVGNWFSSYEYQSPHLSDTHELEFCSPELIVEESDTEGDNSSGIFRKTKSKQDTIIAPGCLKSNDCNESMATDTVSADGAYLNQERENKSTVSLLSASTREVGQESSSFKQEALFCEMKDEPSFSHSGVSCNNQKPQYLAHLQEELRPKQNDHETISTSSSMQKAAQKEEHLESVVINQGSDGKENLEGKSTETGFVTMKKARFRDQSSMTRPIRGVLGECSRSKELTKILREEEEEERKKKRRRVLGEMWNHQVCGGEEEIAGKWSCPQKKKGKSGPPLKQLRLDAWMRKV